MKNFEIKTEKSQRIFFFSLKEDPNVEKFRSFLIKSVIHKKQ